MYEQYIQQLLTIIPIDPIRGPAQNIMIGLKIIPKIIDGLLAAKKDEKKKTIKSVAVLKEDRHALRFFVSKCTDKKASFHYPLTSHPLAIADLSEKLYQQTAKHLFRNEFMKLSCDPIEKIHLRMQFIFTME